MKQLQRIDVTRRFWPKHNHKTQPYRGKFSLILLVFKTILLQFNNSLTLSISCRIASPSMLSPNCSNCLTRLTGCKFDHRTSLCKPLKIIKEIILHGKISLKLFFNYTGNGCEFLFNSKNSVVSSIFN